MYVRVVFEKRVDERSSTLFQEEEVLTVGLSNQGGHPHVSGLPCCNSIKNMKHFSGQVYVGTPGVSICVD